MEADPIRTRVVDLLWQRGLKMGAASVAIGRHRSYLHQFVRRGSPKALSYHDSKKLAEVLGCSSEDLRPKEPPQRRRPKRRFHSAASVSRVLPTSVRDPALALVSELAVEVDAGSGAFECTPEMEVAHWHLPVAMLRHEGGSDPSNLRIVRARGDSMAPHIHGGDRLIVDISRRTPGTGETAVLWDGTGLVVKRVEVLPGPHPRKLRLMSDNRDYPPYTCNSTDVHIAGTVIWMIRRI